MKKDRPFVANDTQTVYFDVDETLVRWYPGDDTEIAIDGHPMAINHKVIDYLILCKKNGNTVVVWSQGGSDWVNEVVTALKINEYVDICLTKPHIYVDDLGHFLWMGDWMKVGPKGDLISDEGFD